jgi:hypothetical protein
MKEGREEGAKIKQERKKGRKKGRRWKEGRKTIYL